MNLIRTLATLALSVLLAAGTRSAPADDAAGQGGASGDDQCKRVQPLAVRLEQKSHQVIAPKVQDACEAHAVTPEALMAILKRLLEREDPGHKRLNEQAPSGLPTGTVAVVHGVIVFDLRAVQAQGLDTLRVEGPKLAPVVVTRFPATGVLEVPVPAPVVGPEYKWSLRTHQNSYAATFVLADDDTRKTLADSLARIERAGATGITRLLLQAAAYDEAQMDTERDQLVREARTQGGL